MTSQLLHHVKDSVCYLTLNNVAKANSLSATLLSKLQDAIFAASNDDQVTSMVITGNGKYFCTGMDLSSGGQTLASDSVGNLYQQRYKTFQTLFDSIASCPKRTIAVVNGSAYGGGIGLVFACDIRIVVEDARFILSEAKRGLTPAVISRYIVREWGASFAREAMITARAVQPLELRSFGAVHHVVKDMEEGRVILAKVLENLRHCAPSASYQSKRLVNAISEQGLSESEVLIKDVFVDMSKPSEEAAYGIKAFQSGKKQVDWVASLKASKKANL